MDAFTEGYVLVVHAGNIQGVGACAAYGTVENVAAVEKAGISVYVVLPKQDERRGPLFGKNEFVYDAEKDLGLTQRRDLLP